MTVLLTGGLGYIGSNVCLVLERAGIQTIIIDDLSNCYLTVKAHLGDLLNWKAKLGLDEMCSSAWNAAKHKAYEFIK